MAAPKGHFWIINVIFDLITAMANDNRITIYDGKKGVMVVKRNGHFTSSSPLSITVEAGVGNFIEALRRASLAK